MAGKGRRTASRQAQLNRKRKRTQKGPSGIPSTARRVADSDAEEAVAVAAGVEDAELEAPEAPEAIGATGGPAVSVGDVPATPRASRPSPVARTPRGEFAGQGQGRLRGERPAAYLYVGAEFRRIMVLTGAILAALIVLGIVL
ncbi:MAG: hypothetical protein IH873_07050 [Chloroflexi bacterium]|nr:hypothetical protein [Chloroflexota bacterium]